MSIAIDRPLDVAPLSAAQRGRRTAVVDAVLALLDETASGEIQMREVSARSGVALATVYRYFPTKEQLLAAAMVTWNQRLSERFAHERPAENASPVERAVVQSIAHLRSYRRRPHHARLEIELHASRDPYVIETLERRAAANRSALFQVIPEVAPERARVASLAIGGTLFTALAMWTTGRITFAAAEANVEDVARLVLE